MGGETVTRGLVEFSYFDQLIASWTHERLLDADPPDHDDLVGHRGERAARLMAMDSKRWHVVLGSLNEHEYESDAMAGPWSRLPNHEPYQVWVNFESCAGNGVKSEEPTTSRST